MVGACEMALFDNLCWRCEGQGVPCRGEEVYPHVHMSPQSGAICAGGVEVRACLAEEEEVCPYVSISPESDEDTLASIAA